MAPRPLACSVEECDFTTPEGTPTWDMMYNILSLHSQTVHGATGQQQQQQQTKLEKLPRPTFSLNSSEASWNFTKTLWDAYISQTPASETVKLQQLQAACEKPLLQRVFDTGAYTTLTTADMFLAKMKELAVITVHKAVHLRNLYLMNQEPDEPIRAYVARLTATADMCDMTMQCQCNNINSYRDLVVHQLVIHSMRDPDIRLRVLSRNTSGELTTLP